MSFNKVDTLPREVAERIHQRRAERATWDEIKVEFGISPVRAKALLVKHGLDHSPLGKLRHEVEMWERPCLRCGSTERRAKWLFRCKNCRRDGRDEYNAADEMYGGFTLGN